MCDGNITPNTAFNTPMNTNGIGDPVPAGSHGQSGSGDRFGGNKKPSKKESSFHHQHELPYIVYKK